MHVSCGKVGCHAMPMSDCEIAIAEFGLNVMVTSNGRIAIRDTCSLLLASSYLE